MQPLLLDASQQPALAEPSRRGLELQLLLLLHLLLHLPS
jgi:hypothetical protein